MRTMMSFFVLFFSRPFFDSFCFSFSGFSPAKDVLFTRDPKNISIGFFPDMRANMTGRTIRTATMIRMTVRFIKPPKT